MCQGVGVEDAPQRRHTLITVFRAAMREMLDELVERLSAAGYPGLRPAHSQVMEHLDRDGTRITELAERAKISHPSMIDLVVALEGLGYLERVPDPGDGRARLVRLTPTGRRLQRHALVELAEIENQWLGQLGVRYSPELADALVHRIDVPITENGITPAATVLEGVPGSVDGPGRERVRRTPGRR